MIHAAVIGLTATFLLLAFDRAGELHRDKYVYVPPAPKVAAAPPVVDPDAPTRRTRLTLDVGRLLGLDFGLPPHEYRAAFASGGAQAVQFMKKRV